MFGSLFFRECKQILKSLIFYIFLAIFIIDITSQMGGTETSLNPPQPGQEYYGYVRSDDPDVIMEKTLATLFGELYGDNFSTYPFGFYKGVRLSDEAQEELTADLEYAAGKDFDTLAQEYEDHFTPPEGSSPEEINWMQLQLSYGIEPKEGYTYAEFETFMEKVSGMVGKGSSYERESYENASVELMTYEQAMEEYRQLCENDLVTRAEIRLYCDYAGIILALLPVFLGVSRCLRDKRSKLTDVVYSKSISGTKIILSRFLANVLMIYLPVLVTAFLLQMPYQYAAARAGITADAFAFLTGTAVWLLPEIMAVLAVSFLITEFTENILAIFVQVFWVFATLFGANAIIGDFGLKLAARWNWFGGYDAFAKQVGDLYLNRGYYVLLSVVCIGLTILVYEKKRKEGATLYGKIFKARR